MTRPDFMFHAYRFDGAGRGEPLTGEAITRDLKDTCLAWVHLDAAHDDTEAWLNAHLDYLDPVIVDALLADETRPRYEDIGKGALIILRGVNLNENADPEDMVSLRLWVDEHRIISLRRRPLKAVEDMEATLLAGTGPRNAGEFLAQLCTLIVDRMEPTLESLDDTIDQLETDVVEKPDATLRRNIIDLRTGTIMLKRYISPQRDAFARMRGSEQAWLAAVRRPLQECYDRTTRFVESLDAVRERAQIVQDELTNSLSDRLNRNMYVLSVVAAIFLPLGFLTGLLGINVGGMPGAENPNAFAITCALLTVIVALQILLFRKMRWL